MSKLINKLLTGPDKERANTLIPNIYSYEKIQIKKTY